MKVLIISNNAISKITNNGKTVRSFLKGLDRSEIANLYFGMNELPDTEICANYYRITEPELMKSIFNLSFKTYNSHDQLMASINPMGKTLLKEHRIIRLLKKNAKTLSPFREILWNFNTWDTSQLNDWIVTFNPDKIFAVLGSACFTHRIARTIAERYKIPLNVYFTDDYVLNVTAENVLQRLHNINVRREYKKTIERAKKAFVIGEKMQFAYEEYYKRSFGVLVNGINVDDYRSISTKYHVYNTPFIISYIGGLHLNRWKSIVEIAKMARNLSEYEFEFRVFCVRKPEQHVLDAFSKENITYCGALSHKEVFTAVENSHCLIHVESFDDKFRKYTRYSVSTKIPEYLASRRGIIVYGPSEIASVELFNNSKIGCVLTDKDDRAMIISKLKDYVASYNTIDFEQQFEYAKLHFNQDNMLLINLL